MQKTQHLLIIDDDKKLRKLLSKFLEDAGFDVTSAENADRAIELLKEANFDVMILDLMMPGKSGLELAVELQKKGEKTPIIMLSAMSGAENRINGLESGADDYLQKPFEPKELLLRINNILKRVEQDETEIVVFGDFTFNLSKQILEKNNEIIALTSSERQLLHFFCENYNQTISREFLAKNLNMVSERSIDVQVNRLRHKIADDPKNPKHIFNIRHKGYVLK